MRKIIASIFLSLDGSFEGPNKESDWHVWDDEMDWDVLLIKFLQITGHPQLRTWLVS